MQDLAARLEAELIRANAGPRVPGVAVGLLHGGREIRVVHGITHAEHPLPVDDRTLFQIASLTKPFTATALLRLADEGRVDLEAPVRRYLPAFALSDAAQTDDVRVRDLITHTSGFFGDRFFLTPPAEPTLAGLVEEVRDTAQLVPPGTLFSYSNAGFSVAGRLVEVLAERPFPEALRALVLDPLGLRHTFLSADEVITHRVAAPHVVGRERTHVLRGAGWQSGWELGAFDRPAGGLISCLHDLLAWARFQLGDGRATGPEGEAGERVLRAETLARMHREVHPAGGDEDAVGLGWLLADRGGVRCSGHTGQTVGYLAEIVLQRERGFALVALTNAVSDGGLRRTLRRFALEACLGVRETDPVPLAEPPTDLAAYEGRYDHPFCVLRVRRGEAPGELAFEGELRPHDPARWQPPLPPPTRYAFVAPDRVVCLAPAALAGVRSDFGRDAAGRVAWIRHMSRVAPRLETRP